MTAMRLPQHHPHHHRCPQRGVAALAVVAALLLVMLLVVAASQGGLVFEQKASTNQYRAMQAQEAAEAGLDWTLAQLNAGRIDGDCQPAAGGTPLRERALQSAGPDGSGFEPFFDPARSGAPACRHTVDGWRCFCPERGLATFPPTQDDSPQASFAIELAGLAPGSTHLNGALRLTSRGCAHLASGSCTDRRGGEPGFAVVTLQSALLPALAALPPAPLVATGHVDLGEDGAGLHNPDSTSGLLVQAGGSLQHAERARLSPPPGTPSSAALVDQEPALARWSADRLLQLHLGLPRANFERLPSVTTVACSADCGPRLREALAQGRRMLRVAGDLVLQDVELGSATEPVLLVADGDVRLGASVRITGVLVGRSLQWQAGLDGRDRLHGAALVAGDVVLRGTPDLVRNADVLALLHTRMGTFTRVPGSWKDTL